MTKKTTRIICVILAALMLLGLVSMALSTRVSAVTQAEIDALQAQRDEIRNQQQNIQEQINALQSERSSAIERKSALDQQNELNQQDIALIEGQIALYDDMIAEKSVELDAAIAAEETQYERYTARVRSMEETNSLSYLSILLQANSLTDFLSRLNDVMDIVTNDQNVKAEYEAAREYVEQVKTEYESIQAQQLAKHEELLTEQERLDQQIQQANTVITNLEDDIESYESAYDQVEAEKNDIQKKIDAKVQELKEQQEAERKAREAYEASLREQQRRQQEEAARQLQLQQQQQTPTSTNNGNSGNTTTSPITNNSNSNTTTSSSTGNTPTSTTTAPSTTTTTAPATTTTAPVTTTASSSGFVWPSPGVTYLTSRFGYRVHPIFGTTKYHSGVDIAASQGSAILAAAGGTVQIAEKSDSYGNYCVIYHSDGKTTLYAHMNALPSVKVGETVSAGQTIGYVGSTGWATGPHLHFEVRVNGSCVDPLGYYPDMSFTYAADA